MIRIQVESDTQSRGVAIVRSAITAEIKKLELALIKTNRQIGSFERKYKTTSGMFRKKMTAEDLKGGDREYIEWSGELHLRDTILKSLKQLREIQYVAR